MMWAVCLHCKRYHGLSCETVSERRFLCGEPPFAFEDDGIWRNVKSPKNLHTHENILVDGPR